MSINAVNVKIFSPDIKKFDLLVTLRGKFLAMKLAYKKHFVVVVHECGIS